MKESLRQLKGLAVYAEKMRHHCWQDFILSCLNSERQKKACVVEFILWRCSAGFSVFVVGVADVEYNELANIASKPSERHVFIVDDFESFEKIEDNLITFVCETATSSKSWSTWIYSLTCGEKKT